MDTHVGPAKAVHSALESPHSGVGDSRTEYDVRSRDDAVGASLNVAGWSCDDDKVIASLHPSELFAHLLNDIWFRKSGAPRAARKHIQRAVATDGRRNDRFRPGCVAGDDSRKARVRSDSQDAGDAARCGIDVNEQSAPRLVGCGCSQVRRDSRNNAGVVARDRDDGDACFHRRDVQIKRSVTLRYDINKRWCLDIRLPAASFHDDFRRLDHGEHASAAYLLRLARVGDVRALELGSKRCRKSNGQCEHHCSGEHRPRWSTHVGKVARVCRLTINACVLLVYLIQLRFRSRIVLLRSRALGDEFCRVDRYYGLHYGGRCRAYQRQLSSHLTALRIGNPLYLAADRVRSRRQRQIYRVYASYGAKSISIALNVRQRVEQHTHSGVGGYYRRCSKCTIR